MRALESLLIVAWGVCLNTTCAFAQAVENRGAQEQIEPYHKHHDRRHGHNHVYPDRGAIIRDVPRGATVVNYAGLSYRFYEGIWFEPRGPVFIVAQPPIGLIIPSVPAFATVVDAGGEPYLYANDVYYRARPDLGGYEVVNDPVDTETRASAGSAAPAAPNSSSGAPGSPPPAIAPAAAGPPAAAAPATAPPVAAVPAPAPSVTAAPAPAPTPPAPAGSAAILVPRAASTSDAAPVAPPVPTSPALPPATTPPVVPPAAAAPVVPPAAAAPSTGAKAFAVPKSPKGPDEQARDQYECYRFAVAQSGFDPMRASGGAPAAQAAGQSDYVRAQAACFEGRGYTVQ